MTMKAIVDADIVAFRCSASREATDLTAVEYLVNSSMEQILSQANATSYEAYLTGRNNFRKLIYPEYKAHRPTEKPYWLEPIRQYLIATFNAEVIDGQEADDALGIAQQLNDTVICSIDKDLLQVPGHHYNFVKDEKIFISNFVGIYNFYTQCLMGDRADNIKGIEGVGVKKAEKILNGRLNEKEMFDAVRDAYGNDEEFIMNAKVLWIRRQPNEDWKDKFNALVQEQIGGTSLESTEEEVPLS